MKLFIRICLSLCAAAMFATSANAQYWNPWSSWWGAGYYGSPAYSAPVYTSYYASPSYTSYYGSSSSGCCGTAAPAYGVSYGSCGTGCCATSCCDACGSGCASGSCGSGSCAGVAPAGTLKPAQDPISDKKTPDYEDDTRPRRFDPDVATPRAPRADDPLNDRLDNRTDQFRSPRSNTNPGLDPDAGSGTGTNMFDESVDPALERTNQKPPMTDPLDGKALDPVDSNSDTPADSNPGIPVDEKTFFDDTSKPDNSVSRDRSAIIARTGSLREVIAPKRLASRSLPTSHRSASGSQLADKSNKTKADAPQPLRWISAPLAEGHVQL